MAGVDLNLSGAVRRTNKGSVDFYYGGGDEAWANLAAAYAGIPSVIRNGKVFGVITAGVISEYWWNDASQLADGDEVPYAAGGTTLTPDQVDAIDNANSPNSGNPFATMADLPYVPSGVATVVDITKASFIGLFAGFDVDPKACYRITDAAQGVVRVYGVTTGTTTAAAFLEGSWDGSVLTDGAWGNYNVSTDTFTEKSGLVITISAVDFAALVTNNLLTIGQQYIVLEAYTSNVWGSIGSPCKFSFLVLADSPNTISSSYCYCYSNLDSRLFQCYTVSDFSEFKIYDPISVQYALTKDIIDAGSYSSEINNNSDIYLLLVTQSLYLKSFFETVIQYKNVVSISDSPFGVGTVGNYDVTTDIFTPYHQIVNFKKEITSAEIKAGGYFDIDEMPSVSGAYWQFCECFAVLAGQTTPYDGVSPILSLWIDGAGDAQTSDLNNILASGNGDGSTYLTIEQAFNTLKVGKGQVRIKTGSTNGDGVLTVYGLARLVTL